MEDEEIFLEQRDSYEFATVNEWFKEVIEETKPDLVVAIARGAVRLLQLSNSLEHVDNQIFISNNALPYLPDNSLKDKRVLVVDDSVIFGSTMAKTREYLFSRGASVFCASFCVDRMSFFGEDHESSGNVRPSIHSLIPLQSKYKFWPIQIRRHHDLLVRSLLCSPMHYNLDFPTYIFKTMPFSEEEVAYICRCITSIKGLEGIEDVSTAVASSAGIYRFSSHTSMNLSQFLNNKEILIKPYGKVRLTLIPSQGEIRVTPIVQLVLPDTDEFNIIFTHDVLNETWCKLVKPKKDDLYYKQGIFQLLTSVMSILCGEALIHQFSDNIRKELGKFNISLDHTDIAFAVGKDNASYLIALHGKIPEELKSQVLEIEATTGPEFLIDHELEQKTAAYWSKNNWLKPKVGETYHEMIGKIFICLRNMTDSRKSRLKNPDASRLEVGYSFENLLNLLTKDCEINISKQQLSYTLDTCVDNGLAVPKILNQCGHWQRAFYAGENENSQDTRQLQLALYEAYSDFLKEKRSRPFTPFDFHKLAVTLKDLYPWLPISTRFYTFGRWAKIGQSEEELIPWLTSNEFSPFNLVDITERISGPERGEEGIQYNKVLVPNPEFRPLVKPTLPINRTRDFYDAFEYIAKAFSQLDQDHLLLVSTCRTQQHTFNAIAFEAHSWAQGKHFNFGQVLQSFKISPDGSISLLHNAMDNIFWCTRYLSEAYRKHIIFYRQYRKLFKKVEKAFTSQGQAAQRFWKLFMFQGDKFSRRIDHKVESRVRAIIDLLSLMKILTAHTIRLLIDLKIITVAELRERFDKSFVRLHYDDYKWVLEGERADLTLNFNNRLRSWNHPGGSFLIHELPCININDGKVPNMTIFQDFLDHYIQCYDQLRSWLSIYCAECEVPEGGFPYLPNTARRVLTDGSIVKLLKDYCILAMDIIRSTDDEQTGNMKIAINETISRFKQPNLFFEKTHNDSFVICADNPKTLWDICFAIAMVGEQIRIDPTRMAGTRKSLSRGSVYAQCR